MTASTLSHLPLMAGGALLGTLGRAGRWTFARYMRAPLASTGLMAMVTMTALAGSNALYFQHGMHPSPFFAQPRDQVAALPTPAVQRPDIPAQPVALPAIEPVAAPVAETQTTGSIAAVPDAPVGNSQAFEVQKKLFELGLFTGKVDGYYGPKTAEAIRAFEQRNGMTPTGALSSGVVAAILGADSAGRVTTPTAPQPQAAVTQPVAPPVVAPAPVQQASLAPQPAPVAPQPVAAAQPQVVAQLQTLSPAERAFDDVAKSAASTIDSIIAAVDTSRGTQPQAVANPPVPSASVPVPTQVAAIQPMPAPVQQAAPQPAAMVQQAASSAPAPIAPASDAELVKQIQRGLASLGFFHAPIDGKPGPETARAIREFENFNRYKMTGQVQPDLVGLLLKAGATI